MDTPKGKRPSMNWNLTEAGKTHRCLNPERVIDGDLKFCGSCGQLIATRETDKKEYEDSPTPLPTEQEAREEDEFHSQFDDSEDNFFDDSGAENRDFEPTEQELILKEMREDEEKEKRAN